MAPEHPIDALHAVSREFGLSAAARKLGLLDSLAGLGRVSATRLRRLHETLCFLRAYPDDPRVHRCVWKTIDHLRDLVERHTQGDPFHSGLANSGLPGTGNSYAYSYAVLQRMVEIGAEMEIDWDEVDDEFPLNLALSNLLAPAEIRGLEDESLWASEWLEECKGDADETDLETLLGLFEQSAYDPQQQMHAFETCDLPVAYALSKPGTGVAEIALNEPRIHYQKEAISRDRFSLAPWIRKPLPASRTPSSSAGQEMLDLSLRTLCARNLEIYPLIYGNPADVTVVDCDKGLKVVLGGVLPEYRTVPETLFFFLTLKNGVPVAYGPASVILGRCEMGINLFPEFRGGEVHLIYAEFMRVMHHLAGARYFYIVPYGMGVDNEDALQSGAFWFYRKMGFRPTNPRVEALAREEEVIMKQKPGYRSNRATLKRLSHTHVYLDLDGNTQRLDCAKLSRSATRRMVTRFGEKRGPSVRKSVKSLVDTLHIQDYASWSSEEKAAMSRVAPIFNLIPDLDAWPQTDRRRLARAIQAQGKPSERNYLHALANIPRLEKAFLELAGVKE